MLHKQQLTIWDGWEVLKPLGFIIPDIFLITLPTHPIGRISDDHIKFIVVEFVTYERITMLDLRIEPKPTLNLRQGVKSIIPVLSEGLGQSFGSLVNPIFNPKQQVTAATGAVIDFQ